MLLFVDFLLERECVEMLGRIKNGHVSTFTLLPASNAENPTVYSQQRIQKLRFMRKLGCQKPCWDQARLSSLRNNPSWSFPSRLFPCLVFFKSNLSLAWSFPYGLSPVCSTLVLYFSSSLSPIWSFLSLVFPHSGLSSVWSFPSLVFPQSGVHTLRSSHTLVFPWSGPSLIRSFPDQVLP